MGQLVDGVWHDTWYDTKSHGGRFVRSDSKFRNWITADGSPGPSGDGGFPAESVRYHLYVSFACPWAHRTLIFRSLKGLQEHIGISVVHPDMLSDGWEFRTDFPGATGDRLGGRKFLREVYTDVKPDISGRVTVPVLFDRQRQTIVSNESAEIIQMFNSAFDDITGNRENFFPADLADEIEVVNERVYGGFNNGVYKAGFATSQAAYDEAVAGVFETMDWMEDRLARHRYLAGDRVTAADWRALPTLVRFDLAYHTHFKCNRNKLTEFPSLWAYTRELYQWPGVAETVVPDHFVRHYHYSHESINPHRIVPINPRPDFAAPHGRDQERAA